MQDIVSIWYVANQKRCIDVDSPFKIWPCTLSKKNLCSDNFMQYSYHLRITEIKTEEPSRNSKVRKQDKFRRNWSHTHTSLVAVVTPTGRPKSVRNRYVIELFCGVVCVVTLPF